LTELQYPGFGFFHTLVFPALSSACLVLLVIAFLGNNIPNNDAEILLSLVGIMKAKDLSSINDFLQCFPLKFF